MTENHKEYFLDIFNRLKANGKFVKPRNQLVLEVENFSYELPQYVRFQSFECRKLNIDYIKKEFLWYLNADRFDLSICNEAKIWKGIVNKDNSINSNYGQYIFNKSNNQFNSAYKQLISDKDSRRASIMILRKEHLLSDTKDVPCTYSLNFRIRENKLNMTVTMRSQDAIFGAGNDIPAFSFIHELMYVSLKSYYSDLEYGNYFHHADSFHLYERHFDMFDKICNGDEYIQISCPKISSKEEVDLLIDKSYSDEYEFTKWLYGKENV